MSQFRDVPTDQLLLFQEFTPVHEAPFTSAQLNVDLSQQEEKGFDEYAQTTNNPDNKPLDDPQNENTGIWRKYVLFYDFNIIFQVRLNHSGVLNSTSNFSMLTQRMWSNEYLRRSSRGKTPFLRIKSN